MRCDGVGDANRTGNSITVKVSFQDAFALSNAHRSGLKKWDMKYSEFLIYMALSRCHKSQSPHYLAAKCDEAIKCPRCAGSHGSAKVTYRANSGDAYFAFSLSVVSFRMFPKKAKGQRNDCQRNEPRM